MNRVAAIIPAYNEAHTIAAVVSAVRSSGDIAEVIVVDDASRDGTAGAAEEAGARVVRLSHNRGKGGAMLAGVAATDAPILAFFDADLRGLTAAHVSALIEPVRNGSLAMNVGLRDRGPHVTALTSRLPLISGERAMLREVFTGVPERFLKGFMVESALNYRCRADGRSYGTTLLEGLTFRRKYEKVGWLRAIPQYVRMAGRVVYAMVVVRAARMVGGF
jgi:glycosyltransferase involved in cell wall biosynthesis